MKIGLLARIEAKPEYADRIAVLLRDAAELAAKEQSERNRGKTPDHEPHDRGQPQRASKRP